MKLGEYIKQLQELEKEHGADITVHIYNSGYDSLQELRTPTFEVASEQCFSKDSIWIWD